jgi:hypothetical protein
MPKQILEAEASHAARVCYDRAPVFNFKRANQLLVLFIHYKSFGILPIRLRNIRLLISSRPIVRAVEL